MPHKKSFYVREELKVIVNHGSTIMKNIVLMNIIK